MDAQGIRINLSESHPDLIFMSICGPFSYADLRDAVEAILLPMIAALLVKPMLIIHHVNAEAPPIGTMSAVFRVTEVLRGRIDLCVIVNAPPIICEAIRMVARIDGDIRDHLLFADTLPEALLMIEARRALLPN